MNPWVIIALALAAAAEIIRKATGNNVDGK